MKPTIAGQIKKAVRATPATPTGTSTGYPSMIQEAQRLALRGVMGPRNGPTYPSCQRLDGLEEPARLREASRMVNEYLTRYVPPLIQQVLNGGSATISSYEAAAGGIDWLVLIGRYWDQHPSSTIDKSRGWVTSITDGVLKDLPRRILAACGPTTVRVTPPTRATVVVQEPSSSAPPTSRAAPTRTSPLTGRYNAQIKQSIDEALWAIFQANGGPQAFCLSLNALSVPDGQRFIRREIDKNVIERVPPAAKSVLQGASVTAPSMSALLAGGQGIPWASSLARFYDANDASKLPPFRAALQGVLSQLEPALLARCSVRAPAPVPTTNTVGREAPPGCEWQYTQPSGTMPGRWNLVCRYDERPYGE